MKKNKKKKQTDVVVKQAIAKDARSNELAFGLVITHIDDSGQPSFLQLTDTSGDVVLLHGTVAAGSAVTSQTALTLAAEAVIGLDELEFRWGKHYKVLLASGQQKRANYYIAHTTQKMIALRDDDALFVDFSWLLYKQARKILAKSLRQILDWAYSAIMDDIDGLESVAKPAIRRKSKAQPVRLPEVIADEAADETTNLVHTRIPGNAQMVSKEPMEADIVMLLGKYEDGLLTASIVEDLQLNKNIACQVLLKLTREERIEEIYGRYYLCVEDTVDKRENTKQ